MLCQETVLLRMFLNKRLENDNKISSLLCFLSDIESIDNLSNDISSNDILSNDTLPGDSSSKDVPIKWLENDNKISLPRVFLSDIESVNNLSKHL